MAKTKRLAARSSLFLGLLLYSCCFIGVDSASVTEFEAPDGGSVYLEETASFRCTFEDPETSLDVYWQVREGTFLGPNTNHNSDALTYQRYTIETDRTNNNSTLTIVNAEYSDSGNYSCSLSMNSDIVDKSEEVSFQVISQAPEDGYPKCYMNIDEDQVYIEGDEASISCVSRGGIPPSSLRWEIDGSALNAAQSSEDSTVYSNYSWSLVPENDGSVITCFESHIDFPEERFCNLSLQVEYEPVISTHIDVDGDCITFTCTATANPAQVSNFTWSYQGSDALEGTDRFEALDPAASMVKMRNVTEDDLGNTIVCTASNSVGSTAASMTIPPKTESTTDDGDGGFSLSTLEIIIIIVVVAAFIFLVCIIVAIFTTCKCGKKDDSDRQDKYAVNMDEDQPREGRVDMAEDAYGHSDATINQPPAASSVDGGGTVNDSFQGDIEAGKPAQNVEDLYARPNKTSSAALSVGSNEDNTAAGQNIEDLYARPSKKTDPSTQSGSSEGTKAVAGNSNVLY